MARKNIKYCKLEEDGTEYTLPVEHIPDAGDIAFSASPFLSDNAKDAIVEARNDSFAVAGFAALATSNTTISTGKYLEFGFGITSDTNPFPIPRSVIVTEIAIRAPLASTISLGVYKRVNGVETLFHTASLSNETANNYVNLSYTLTAGQDISVKCTAGSASKPTIAIYMRKES